MTEKVAAPGLPSKPSGPVDQTFTENEKNIGRRISRTNATKGGSQALAVNIVENPLRVSLANRGGVSA